MALTANGAFDNQRDGYEDEGGWQKFLLDAYLGTGGFEGRIRRPLTGFWGLVAQNYSGFAHLLMSKVDDTGSYLDRHDKEDDEKFLRRTNVAHYSNYVRATTNIKVSYLERKPHKRNNVPDELTKWIEATGYDKEFRRRALVAAVLGWFPMLVDLPRKPRAAQTAAQAGKMDPYVVLSLPCHLVDYQLDEDGRFIWAKMVSSFVKKAAWDSEAVTVKRYTVWTKDDFKIFEQVGEGEPTPVPDGEGKHKFGQVPIVSWRADVSVVDDIKADSINADIAPKARRLFNLESELDEHMRGQVFALLVWPGAAPAGNEGGATVGTENGLLVGSDQKNMPFYLAPPPTVASTYESRITAMVIELYRVAMVEYERASGVKSSAQSKENEFGKTNAQLVSMGTAFAAADRETLILVGRAKSIAEDKLQAIECVAHESYADEALGDELEQSISALGIPQLGRQAHIELLKRLVQKLLPGMSAETRKTVESEIEEAVDQAIKDVEAAKEALTKDDDGDGGGDDDPDDAEEDEEDPPGNTPPAGDKKAA